MLEWERNREQAEFDRAAVLYHSSKNHNVSSSVSSRFIAASTNEELDVGKEAASIQSASQR